MNKKSSRAHIVPAWNGRVEEGGSKKTCLRINCTLISKIVEIIPRVREGDFIYRLEIVVCIRCPCEKKRIHLAANKFRPLALGCLSRFEEVLGGTYLLYLTFRGFI